MIQLQETSRPSRSGTPTGDVVVVCAADDAYVMPLTVALHSLGRHLAPGRRAQLYFLDGGLRDESWAGLKESLADQPLDFTVIRPDAAAVRGLKTSHHITHTAYFRLLAAELLPDDQTRAIYLDSDVLVRDDVGRLWDLPINDDQYCLAVPDIACPFVDSRRGSPNYRRASPYMAAICPIANYRQLGLNGAAEYFNSGVMAMNLSLWRRENVAERLLRCLRDNERYVWCWDQYALNVVFAEQWGRIHPCWNQGAHTFEYPSVEHSPIDAAEFVELRQRPSIIHFTTEFKPWSHRTRDPRAHLYFAALDETAWSGWRPDRPRFSVRRWWQERAVEVQRHVTISYRKMAARWA